MYVLGIRQLYSGLFATALDEAEAGMAGKMADDQSRTPDDQAASSGISAVAGTAAALLPMLLGGVKSKNSISPMPKIGRETVSTKQPIQDTTQNLRVINAIVRFIGFSSIFYNVLLVF